MKYLFIDIRESDEVYAKHFDQFATSDESRKYSGFVRDVVSPENLESPEYSFYNIPMNMIRFNAQTIVDHLKYIDEIYIVCQSGNRSQFIKNKYFKEHDRIKVSQSLQFSNLNHGPNNVSFGKNTNIPIHIVGSNSFNFYNVMRIIQTILGIIMISTGVYIYLQLRNEKLVKRVHVLPFIILVAFGSMALYNGITSTCSISILLQDYLN